MTWFVRDRDGYLAQALTNAMATVRARQIRGYGKNQLWRPVVCEPTTLLRLSDAQQPWANPVEATVMVSEQLRKLDPPMQEVALRILCYGDTGREAGRALGVSHTTIQKRLRQWYKGIQPREGRTPVPEGEEAA
jgi:hypothetical protein